MDTNRESKSVERAARWIASGIALAACVTGCSKKVTESPAVAQTAASAQAAATTPAPEVTVHGIRRLAHPDVPVFVDGKQVGVLRYGELPPSVKALSRPGDDWTDERYYRLTDYLKAVGVATERVSAVHFKGQTNRIMSLEGSEIRADKARFLFDFSMKTTGLPREGWKLDGLKSTTWIDYVAAVYVYASRPVPAVDPVRHCYWVEADQECQGDAPYAEGELAKGTRVYVDGKLAGYVKRRRIEDSMIVGKTDDGTVSYSLSAVIASFGVDLKAARGVELLSGDNVVARATREQWLAKQSLLSFTLPKHGHGKVRALVPADMQIKDEGAKDRESIITAVEVYRSVDPSTRPLTALDDVPEIALTGDSDKQAALGSGQGRADEL